MQRRKKGRGKAATPSKSPVVSYFNKHLISYYVELILESLKAAKSLGHDHMDVADVASDLGMPVSLVKSQCDIMTRRKMLAMEHRNNKDFVRLPERKEEADPFQDIIDDVAKTDEAGGW